MATAAQITANQANSQLSTGPRTAEGKLASAQNARRHGFTSMTLSVPEAARDEFEKFQQFLHADVHPEGAIEESLFERLLLACWNLRRITRYETELLDETNPFASGDSDQAACFERLTRYRRDLERSSSRTLAELRKLQTQRAVLLQLPPRAAEAICQSAPLAELTEITNDTDHFIKQSSGYRRTAFHKDRAAALEEARNPKKLVIRRVVPTEPPADFDPLKLIERFTKG